MVRLNVELVHRHIADAPTGIFVDAAEPGQGSHRTPALELFGVERLERAPVPDDREVVKGLVVDVVGFRIERRLSLASRTVQRLEGEVGGRAHPYRFEKRYKGAEDLKRPAPDDSGRLRGELWLPRRHLQKRRQRTGSWFQDTATRTLGRSRQSVAPVAQDRLRFSRARRAFSSARALRAVSISTLTKRAG